MKTVSKKEDKDKKKAKKIDSPPKQSTVKTFNPLYGVKKEASKLIDRTKFNSSGGRVDEPNCSVTLSEVLSELSRDTEKESLSDRTQDLSERPEENEGTREKQEKQEKQEKESTIEEGNKSKRLSSAEYQEKRKELSFCQEEASLNTSSELPEQTAVEALRTEEESENKQKLKRYSLSQKLDLEEIRHANAQQRSTTTYQGKGHGDRMSTTLKSQSQPSPPAMIMSEASKRKGSHIESRSVIVPNEDKAKRAVRKNSNPTKEVAVVRSNPIYGLRGHINLTSASLPNANPLPNLPSSNNSFFTSPYSETDLTLSPHFALSASLSAPSGLPRAEPIHSRGDDIVFFSNPLYGLGRKSAQEERQEVARYERELPIVIEKKEKPTVVINPMFAPRLQLIDVLAANRFEVMSAVAAVANPEHYEQLARAIFMVFNTSEDKCFNLMKWALSYEVEKTAPEKSAQLFRSTNIPCKLISLYFRKNGFSFLLKVLKDTILSVNSLNYALEVDPNKTDVRNIPQNQEQIETVCSVIFSEIKKNCSFFPKNMAALLNYGETKFPERKMIILGGLFFLRFLCPAIAAPADFVPIIEDTPSIEKRRSLILICKIIQNIANNVQFGDKEEYMLRFNPFLDNIPQLNEIYASLLDISNRKDPPRDIGLPNFLWDGDEPLEEPILTVNQTFILHSEKIKKSLRKPSLFNSYTSTLVVRNQLWDNISIFPRLGTKSESNEGGILNGNSFHLELQKIRAERMSRQMEERVLELEAKLSEMKTKNTFLINVLRSVPLEHLPADLNLDNYVVDIPEMTMTPKMTRQASYGNQIHRAACSPEEDDSGMKENDEEGKRDDEAGSSALDAFTDVNALARSQHGSASSSPRAGFSIPPPPPPPPNLFSDPTPSDSYLNKVKRKSMTACSSAIGMLVGENSNILEGFFSRKGDGGKETEKKKEKEKEKEKTKTGTKNSTRNSARGGGSERTISISSNEKESERERKGAKEKSEDDDEKRSRSSSFSSHSNL
eukprot:TRINITY_DN953_c0_g2_i2.p1 TRINITY_DN953_c0_g2~~TRINITY_DN953_c0_g2_i2.p1  ORF type:complete len:1007 (+),score=234.23 TRINITY_DN953_c0_g2_i2:39-3059(+)